MAQNKTIATTGSVTDFLNSITDAEKREDSFALLALMEKITGEKPVLWGTSIIGFGSYHYKYDSGREGDMPLTGFSPRKQNLTIYIMAGFTTYAGLLEKLGPYKTGKSCLYIKRLSQINIAVLQELIAASYQRLDTKYNQKTIDL